MIVITCKKAFAQANCRTAFLTAGMSRAETVRFVFSDDWCGLSKTAVFTDGAKTVDVLPPGWDGDTVPIPHEILTTAGRTARVGVYGTNASGVVLPTVWATLGKVQPAAEPSGDPSTDPTLPVWAQLQEIIGDLADLTTKAKNNLVAAINEAAKTGSGGAGSIDLRTADGYIQYSNDGGATWENLIALAELKGGKGDTGATGPQGAPGKDGSPGKDGADGAPGQDGFSPSASVAQTSTGATITITDKTGTTTAEIKNGKDGAPGEKGDTGATGPQGAPGADYTLTAADKTEIAAEAAAAIAGTSVPAPASAAVGQIVKIKAVDAEGKITETEAVDLPTGGGGADIWEIIADYTATEVASWITINKDTKGNSFSLKKVDVELLLPSAVSGGSWYLYLSPSTEFFGQFTIASQGSAPCRIRCTASSDDIVTIGLKRDKDYSSGTIGLDRKDSYKAITAVRLGNWSDLTFPAGARMLVKGVRI